MNEKEISLSIAYADELGELTSLTRTYNEDCHEDIGTAGWLLEQFKYFLKACGYANETVDKLIFLEYGEKVIDSNGELIYEYK